MYNQNTPETPETEYNAPGAPINPAEQCPGRRVINHMLLYIGPGDDGLPGAVRENSARWRGMQTGFFGDDHFSGSHRNLLTANSRSIQFQKLASLTQVLSKSFRKFPFRSLAGHRRYHPTPPPSRAAGGSDQPQKDVSRDGYLWVSNRERPGLMDSIM